MPETDDADLLQEPLVENKKRGSLWKLLDHLEQYLLKMIFGVFKFIFYRFPKFVWDTLANWFPTIVKFIKVSVLLCFWIIIVIGPLGYLYYEVFGITLHPIDIEIEFWTIVDAYGMWPMAWSLIALIGSFWGLIYVKRITWRWWKRRADRKSRNEASNRDNEASGGQSAI